MTDPQPPAGAQPPHQGYPPQGQGQQPPPGYYQQGPPPKKKHTLRNVLLILGLLFILFVGGCLAITASIFNEADKAIKAEEANDKPKAVAEGKAFTHDDYQVASGWTVGRDFGGVTIKGLKVTNNADESRSALLTFRFYKGTENLAEVTCTSNEVAKGETSALDCGSLNSGFPKGYDTIKVADTF
jgi:hypothetical protein